MELCCLLPGHNHSKCLTKRRWKLDYNIIKATFAQLIKTKLKALFKWTPFSGARTAASLPLTWNAPCLSASSTAALIYILTSCHNAGRAAIIRKLINTRCKCRGRSSDIIIHVHTRVGGRYKRQWVNIKQWRGLTCWQGCCEFNSAGAHCTCTVSAVCY